MAFIGLDITDEYIAVHVGQSESVLIKPAVLGCEKDGSVWYAGEDAYRAALSGSGVMADGLLTLLEKDGVRELGGTEYTACALLSRLLSMLIEKVVSDEKADEVTHVTAALHKADKELFDRVKACLVRAGCREEEITVISHEEAFIYFVLSQQDKSLYNGNVALFDLRDGAMTVYGFMIQRGTGRQYAVCRGYEEEGFRTEILRTDTGKNLGDRIMTETAKRHMEGRLFSAVFLTGSGFSGTDWAREFITYTCRRRRLMLETGLFAIGASHSSDSVMSQYVFLCDTRTSSELSMPVEIKGREAELMLIPEGERWHGLQLHAEVMPCGQDYMDFVVTGNGSRTGKQRKRFMLDAFPAREDRTLRLSVEIETVSAKAVKITISDMGFGDIYPPSGVTVSEEMEI